LLGGPAAGEIAGVTGLHTYCVTSWMRTGAQSRSLSTIKTRVRIKTFFGVGKCFIRFLRFLRFLLFFLLFIAFFCSFVRFFAPSCVFLRLTCRSSVASCSDLLCAGCAAVGPREPPTSEVVPLTGGYTYPTQITRLYPPRGPTSSTPRFFS
jgi:hypothetical protein